MSLVLCLVASQDDGLSPDLPAALASALTPAGLIPGGVTWLAPGRAADVMLEPGPDPVVAIDTDRRRRLVEDLRASPQAAGLDIALLPASNRRKRLLLADMDSTIVAGETLDELAANLGLKDKIAAITARAMAGELDFESALRERVGMLRGLPESAIGATLSELVLNPGARTLVQTMAAGGAHTVLVSGGFTDFTRAIALSAGFAEQHANLLERRDGYLTGTVGEPILGRAAKRETLRRTAERLGLSLNDTLAVGDGANDADMIGEAGLGVGYRPKPLLREVADACVLKGDLTTLLYFQGYRRDDFAA